MADPYAAAIHLTAVTRESRDDTKMGLLGVLD
jgi:hypothetical protein